MPYVSSIGGVPEGQVRIGQRLNVGIDGLACLSREGTTDKGASVVPSGLTACRVPVPNVETLGYSRLSLRDKEDVNEISRIRGRGQSGIFRLVLRLLWWTILLLLPASIHAQAVSEAALAKISFEQKLNNPITLGASFRDES